MRLKSWHVLGVVLVSLGYLESYLFLIGQGCDLRNTGCCRIYEIHHLYPAGCG